MNSLNQNNEFSYTEKNSNLLISFNRSTFIFFVFLILTAIFSFKIIYLGYQKKNITKKIITKSDFRSSILDRDGNILAKSVITTNIGINPNYVVDKKKLLLNLRLIFPEKNIINLKKKLEGKKFFYLEKKIF